jgi:hypothetical protein
MAGVPALELVQRQCGLMTWQDGFTHFLSRSYVHHACSQTIGRGGEADRKNHLDAEPWLKANRPDLHKLYFPVNS